MLTLAACRMTTKVDTIRLSCMLKSYRTCIMSLHIIEGLLVLSCSSFLFLFHRRAGESVEIAFTTI